MKILFYDTKSYDKESFQNTLKNFPGIEIEYTKSDLDARTAALAAGFDAVCAFVSSDLGTQTVEILHQNGIRLILMRCAGFNNVDLDTVKKHGIRIMRVPGYSPEAVAEHAMALALAANRRLHKAYNGFGMKVLAYDVYENPDLKEFVEYVTLEKLLSDSDVISLHCPLMDSTYHIINIDTIRRMKDGVVLVNTSRGALVKTDDLIEGIRMHKFAGVGLDVYEEETNNVFEDRSDEILEHSTTARLLSFPNVMITSHQGFFTREALSAIAETTLQNALDYQDGKESTNDVI